MKLSTIVAVAIGQLIAKGVGCVVLGYGGIRFLEAGHPWFALLCFFGVLLVGAS